MHTATIDAPLLYARSSRPTTPIPRTQGTPRCPPSRRIGRTSCVISVPRFAVLPLAGLLPPQLPYLVRIAFVWVFIAAEASIPEAEKLKDELEEHRRRILELKIALVNVYVLLLSSEAVRLNAHIPHEQFDQPLLRPLLHPFAVGAPLGTPDGVANGAGDTRLMAQDKKRDSGKNGKKNSTANGNGAGAGGSANAGGTAARNAAPGVAVGVPSPLFPRSVYDFRAMDARPARQPVLDYGLAGGDGQDEEDWDDDASTVKEEKETGKKGNMSKDDKTPKTESAKEKAEREKEAAREAEQEAKLYTREVRRAAHLNEFLRFIGRGRRRTYGILVVIVSSSWAAWPWSLCR